MKILIVDDDQDICALLKMFFESRNFRAFTATSLIDGLKVLDDEQPDILFMDNVLPDGDGWKAAQTAKLKYPDMGVNLMSAKDKSFHSLEEYDDIIWEKPIAPQQLEAYLQFLSRSIQV